MNRVPGWRREPYRVLFPLGLLMAWAGVLHWFLYGLGLLPDYRPVFHSIVQIQGFMICFAGGFLLTAIPRRTGTAPPAAWQMLAVAGAPVGSTLAAWFQSWALSQVFWMLLMIVLLGFAVPRFLSAGATRRPPNSFLWVPFSLAMGIGGSCLIGVYGVLGDEYYLLHELGRSLLLEGMFLGLVLGIGGMALPLITRGDAPPDAGGSAGDRLSRVTHLAAAVLLAGSFYVEVYLSLRGGLALRAAVVLVTLLVSSRIHRPPAVPGSHRWLVWLAAWMIPAGYLTAFLFAAQKKAGLHAVFIGGFALMALSVGLHVILAHGGHERLVRGRPWQVPVYGGLIVASVVLRALVDFDPQRFFVWITAASGLFLASTLIWASLALPNLWQD